jgi:hypothetical protein
VAKANFAIVKFGEHLGNDKADLDAPAFTFVGDRSSEKEFEIEGKPVGEGYVLLNIAGVQSYNHRILINGRGLGGRDIPATGDRWDTWMDGIEEGVLRQGTNTIQVRRGRDGDNFLVEFAVVHWRESE